MQSFMEKIFVISFVICLIVISSEAETSFVVSKLDTKTLGIYFHRLQERTNGNIKSVPSFFSYRTLPKLCHLLRISNVYEVAKQEETLDLTISSNWYALSIDQINIEKNQKMLESVLMHVDKNGTKVLKKIPSLKCFNVQGDMRIYVTPAFVPESAFLFTIESDFQYIFTKQLQHLHSITPKLTAIVDAQTIFSRVLSRTEFEDIPDVLEHFIKSMELTKFNKIETLCELNRMMTFRLCSIVSNYLAPDLQILMQNATITMSRSPNIYWERGINYYYQPVDPKEHCRTMKVSIPSKYRRNITIIRREMLSCSTNIILNRQTPMRKIYKFYLSHNKLERYNVFLFYETTKTEYANIADMIYVPLLKYLPQYLTEFGGLDI